MKQIKSLIAAAGILAVGALPTVASADHWHDAHHHRIHDSGNGWRDLSILGGVAGIAGVVTHNSTLAAVGLGGALYSGYRYEQDRAHDRDWGYRGYDHRRYDDHRSRHHGW